MKWLENLELMFYIFRAVRKFIELINKYISNRNPLGSLVLKFEALFSKC